MSKIKKMALTVLGILIVLFNVVVFAIPIDKSAMFWLSYGFTTLAFILQIGVCIIAFGKAYTMKSKFLGYPIFHIGFVYLAIQLAACAVFLALSAIAPVWAAVIVYALILGITMICLITVDVARDEINRVEEKVGKKVFFIKSLQADVEMLAAKSNSKTFVNELRELIDAVKYSDPMSNDALSPLEDEISEKADQLKQAVSDNDDSANSLIKELTLLLAERNKRCRISK